MTALLRRLPWGASFPDADATCSPTRATQAARPHGLTHVSLVLKWLPQAQFAGYYVALKKGYYAKEGLDLTIQPGGPTIVPEQVVANGGADLSGIDWLPWPGRA